MFYDRYYTFASLCQSSLFMEETMQFVFWPHILAYIVHSREKGFVHGCEKFLRPGISHSLIPCLNVPLSPLFSPGPVQPIFSMLDISCFNIAGLLDICFPATDVLMISHPFIAFGSLQASMRVAVATKATATARRTSFEWIYLDQYAKILVSYTGFRIYVSWWHQPKIDNKSKMTIFTK